MKKQSHHSAKYYSLRHAAKHIRHWFGTKEPAYTIIRREMRKVERFERQRDRQGASAS